MGRMHAVYEPRLGRAFDVEHLMHHERAVVRGEMSKRYVHHTPADLLVFSSKAARSRQPPVVPERIIRDAVHTIRPFRGLFLWLEGTVRSLNANDNIGITDTGVVHGSQMNWYQPAADL